MEESACGFVRCLCVKRIMAQIPTGNQILNCCVFKNTVIGDPKTFSSALCLFVYVL